MSSLILYLLESSVVLAILYLSYRGLLGRETFFGFNRFFLLAIPVLSLLVPLLRFDRPLSPEGVVGRPVEELRSARLAYYRALEEWSSEQERLSVAAHTHSHATEKMSTPRLLLATALVIYGTGCLVVIFRLIGTYRWIRQLKRLSPSEIIDGTTVVKTSYPAAPFSFLNAVFVHQDTVRGDDFATILAHERVHVRERHSVDLLLTQSLAAVWWFNPVIWLLIKSLKATHEYIADRRMINQGYSLVGYQTLLLSQLVNHHSPQLVHYFNLLSIKKRIIMMKAEKSGRAGYAKVALALSNAVMVGLATVQCHSKVEEQLWSESPTADPGRDVPLPILPDTEYQFVGDLSDPLSLTIADNQLTIDGEAVEIDEIASVLAGASAERAVVMRVDRDQPMAPVRDVQQALRRAGLLKLLYVGQTATGTPVKIPFLLPPHPARASEPPIDEAYAQANNIGLLKIEASAYEEGVTNQQRVYDFVQGQLAERRSDYVVSFRFADDDPYGAYLTHLFHLKESFYQIYDERAQAVYGKRFSEISAGRSDNEAYQAMYEAVLQGVPMAISVAEE